MVEETRQGKEEVHISFMDRKGNDSFDWPFSPFKRWLPTKTLLSQIWPPIPISQTCFKLDCNNKINNMFKKVMEQ